MIISNKYGLLFIEVPLTASWAIHSVNKTPAKRKNFLEYYTREIIPAAKRACGPFMKKWGYHFPDEWADHYVSLLDEVKYRSFNMLRFFYTVYLRYNNAAYAIFLRKIRARPFP
jgi:hypothetical protein